MPSARLTRNNWPLAKTAATQNPAPDTITHSLPQALVHIQPLKSKEIASLQTTEPPLRKFSIHVNTDNTHKITQISHALAHTDTKHSISTTCNYNATTTQQEYTTNKFRSSPTYSEPSIHFNYSTKFPLKICTSDTHTPNCTLPRTTSPYHAYKTAVNDLLQAAPVRTSPKNTVLQK